MHPHRREIFHPFVRSKIDARCQPGNRHQIDPGIHLQIWRFSRLWGSGVTLCSPPNR